MKHTIKTPEMDIRSYLPSDEQSVIALWRKCRLCRPQNDPETDIARKMRVNPELFLVGIIGETLVASAMGGYEGHRGWINYLAVDPDFQRHGLGRILVRAIEKRLVAMGCPKINLQVREDNLSAMKFYDRLGFSPDKVISFGKRLIEDEK